jgi:hypothetical protein
MIHFIIIPRSELGLSNGIFLMFSKLNIRGFFDACYMPRPSNRPIQILAALNAVMLLRVP